MIPKNAYIRLLVRERIIRIYKRKGADFNSYTREWQEYVQEIAWKSIYALATAKGIGIQDAIDKLLP